MQESKTKKTFVAGALLLGAAGVIVKLIGLFFRVPLTNIIGRAGMGYYQMAYPIYAAILAISTSGLPTAISRMISERRSVGKYYEAYRVFRVSFYVMLTLGVVTSVGLFVFAPMIARIQETPDAVYSHRAMALALLLCPILSCYRGFFQGHRNMVPTAVSQVVEQVFRAIVGLSLAAILLKVDLPHAAAGGNFGASAGALFGLIAILFLFQKNRGKMMAEIRISGKTIEQSTAGITRELIVIALPITIGACIMPIVNGIDTLMVVDRLETLGIAEESARELFSELSAMALPIANMPQIFTQAVVQSLVPVISDAFKRDDMDFVRYNANLGLRYAFLVALPCACGMAVLSRPIMQLFYPTQMEGVPNAAVCLCIYSVSLVCLASNQALSAVLQGIGKQNIPLWSLVTGAAVKVAVTFVLLGVSGIHVRGAAQLPRGKAPHQYEVRPQRHRNKAGHLFSGHVGCRLRGLQAGPHAHGEHRFDLRCSGLRHSSLCPDGIHYEGHFSRGYGQPAKAEKARSDPQKTASPKVTELSNSLIFHRFCC